MGNIGFIHVVYFWMKPDVRPSDIEKLGEGIRTLAKIDTVSSIVIGQPAQTPREVVDNSYAWSLLVLFKDRESHDAYQDHPIHYAFVERYGHLWERVQVYDSIPEEQ